jgi:hypothetical protein
MSFHSKKKKLSAKKVYAIGLKTTKLCRKKWYTRIIAFELIKFPNKISFSKEMSRTHLKKLS